MIPDLTQRGNDPDMALSDSIDRLGELIRAAIRHQEILANALLDLRARFAERAEADAPDAEGYRPNEAMQIVTAIDAALKRAGVEVPT